MSIRIFPPIDETEVITVCRASRGHYFQVNFRRSRWKEAVCHVDAWEVSPYLPLASEDAERMRNQILGVA